MALGHSLGGFLTMDAAAEDPKRFLGLVLHGCSARARGPAAWLYRLALRLLSRVPEPRLARWNDAFLRRRYAPELVEVARARAVSWLANS